MIFDDSSNSGYDADMSKRTPTFTEQLRTLIETSGETRYRIGVETRIDHATISRFMNGQGGLSMPNLDALADYLGWKIITTKKNKSPKQTKGE